MTIQLNKGNRGRRRRCPKAASRHSGPTFLKHKRYWVNNHSYRTKPVVFGNLAADGMSVHEAEPQTMEDDDDNDDNQDTSEDEEKKEEGNNEEDDDDEEGEEDLFTPCVLCSALCEMYSQYCVDCSKSELGR